LRYFLVLNTIVDWCAENDVLVGPGRGSAAGCLLAYALGLTFVDPIKEDLSFERFFDVTRVEDGLADIDTDFSDRNKVVDFIKERWGDCFAYIGTGTQFKTKSSLKDIDRYMYGDVRPETIEVCKYINTSPQGQSEEDFLRGHTDKDDVYHEGELETNMQLRKYLNENPKSLEALFKMIGIQRQMGRHAAGVLIANKPIHSFMPVRKISGEWTTQLLPKWVEHCGGVKYDILGVNTLEDIRLCINLIKKRTGKVIKPWEIEDNVEFWEAAINNPVTVFQLHTETVREGLQTMRPKNVLGASILTSIFRPGATDAPSDEDPTKVMSTIFLERWTKKRKIKYVHKDLEPYLEMTVGVITWQEQIMKIVHELGGLSTVETNKLRKAISKKTGDALIELLQKVNKTLVNERKWTKEQAHAIIEQMKASGRYSFNKSHAMSYCYIARACAYFKYYYPMEWWTAVLTNADKDDLRSYWHHVSDIILPVDINESSGEFTLLTKKGNKEYILSPLSMIDGIGPAVMEEILKKRPFKSFDDFLERINRSVVNKRVVLKLIFGGALAQFFDKSIPDFEKMQMYMHKKAKLEGKKNPETVPEEYRAMTPLKKYLLKKSVFKVYNGNLREIAIPKLESMKLISKPFSNAKSWIFNHNSSRRRPKKPFIDLKRYSQIIESDDAHEFAIIGYLAKTKDHKYSNKQKTMLKIQFEVQDRMLNLVKWPPYKKNHHGIKVDLDETVCIIVMSKRKGSDAFVDDIIPIERFNL